MYGCLSRKQKKVTTTEKASAWLAGRYTGPPSLWMSLSGKPELLEAGKGRNDERQGLSRVWTTGEGEAPIGGYVRYEVRVREVFDTSLFGSRNPPAPSSI